MGRKGHEIGKYIIKELEDKSKSEKTIKELNINIKTRYFPELDGKKFFKAFYRDLNRLLNVKEIEIIGFKSKKDIKVKQSFDSESIILKLSKRLARPDIQHLLNEMGENKESYQDIKKRFKEKIEDLYRFHRKRWQFLEERTFKVTPHQLKEILSEFYYYDDIEKIIAELTEDEKDAFLLDYSEPPEYIPYIKNVPLDFEDLRREVYSLIQGVQLEIENKEKKAAEKNSRFAFGRDNIVEKIALKLILANSIENKYKDMAIWYYPVSPSEFNDPFHWEIGHLSHQKMATSFNKGDPSNYNIYYETILYEQHSKMLPGWWDKFKALYYGGFEYPESGIEFPDIHFESMIDIIYTYPDEEEKILKRILAKGLSDEPGSTEVFAELFKKFKSVDYGNRLNNVLGIVSEHTETVSHDELVKPKKDSNRQSKQLPSIKDLKQDYSRGT